MNVTEQVPPAPNVIQQKKPNIIKANKCSLSLRQWQDANGVDAAVYNVRDSQTTSLLNDLCSLESFVPNSALSLLSYAHLAEINSVPDSQDSMGSNKEDILTQSHMLKTEDKQEFIKCQRNEIEGLRKFDVMDILSIKDLPPRARLLSSIWSYRRKRLPNGVLLKYKSRICVNGKEQAFGRDYWETYAPVASWATIRLMLILSSLLNLKTRQVDYTQAFPQASLDVPVCMRVPQGWFVKDGELHQHENPKFNETHFFMKLKRNLYGCKQAARNWFLHLTQGLLKLGFHQSTTDNCLFIRDDCILVVYVDDCLIFAKDDAVINDLIKALSVAFLLQDEGDVNAFLGVQIRKDPKTKTLTLTQPNLIQQILHDIGFCGQSKGKETPTDSILHADVDGLARGDTWNYRSVIGKLNYLANNTRPDISMAVHQCARYCTNPKALHELAVKRIARYLPSTQDKGLILHPTSDLSLDMYVDADFAGRWRKDFSELRDSVLSRTGYVIQFCGCPITWASKLQSEIALSTTESEYIALSTATRDLIPLRRILSDIHASKFISVMATSFTDCVHSPLLPPSRVFEDNNACNVLATKDQHFKPRTKHISLKFHHFQDQVRQGILEIVKVGTHDNLADIFTKPLGKVKFQHLRWLLMGW